MKSKGHIINTLGFLSGILSLIIIVIAIYYFVIINPVNRESIKSIGQWGKSEEEKIVDGDYSTIDVKNISGSIKVIGWDKKYFRVRSVKSGLYVKNIEVKIDTSGNVISIKPVSMFPGGKYSGSVAFEIAIPESVKNIRVESVSGSIELSNIFSGVDQNLKTVSGKIQTDNASNLSVKSISGSIQFRFNGSDLYAKTISGSIKGDITGTIKGNSYNLSSVSGSILLNVKKDFGADLILKSVSGSVSSDLPIIIDYQKKNHIEGEIGDGLISVNIQTTSGSIKIKEI